MPLFLTCREKQTFQVFLSLFLRVSIFWLKRDVFSEFPPKCFKTKRKHNLAVCGSFCGEKQFLFIIVPFTDLYLKGCLQQILIFLLICPFLTCWKKETFQVFLSFFLRVNFLTKKRCFQLIPQKCFKTTKKHSLAVCGSFWGEKQFLLIFVPFYWFDQKQLFKQIQIFLRICPFLNLLTKTNFLINPLRYLLFWLKWEFFSEFHRKCFKITKKHSLAAWGSFWGEKQ